MGQKQIKGMELKQFIRIGNHYLNLNHIAYILSVPNGLRIVTTSQRDDGKPYAIVVKTAYADKVRKALEPFVAFSIETPAES
jgi:hypothetical protein